jgi:N-ethylmaleimide reductase
MGYTATEAAEAISAGKIDAVTFGIQFLANPDLPARFKTDAPLNEPDSENFYTWGAEGYTDYPSLIDGPLGDGGE